MTADALPSGLLRQLRSAVQGEVETDPEIRAMYSSDASNYRVVPSAIVAPRSDDDVSAVLAICSASGATVTMRGGGTSVAGNAIGKGVLLDTSRHLNRIRDLDVENRTVTVEPGVVLDDLNRTAGVNGLRLGPDPSTHSRCTIGGMIGNNACGPRSIAWGTTADNVDSIDVALADGLVSRFGPGSTADPYSVCRSNGRVGEVARSLRDLVASNTELIHRELKPWSRRISGYALEWLLPERGFDIAKALVGTEGTCAVTLSSTMRLVERPPSVVLVVVPFPSDIAAARAVPEILAQAPQTVEAVTSELFGPAGMARAAELLPPGKAWLLVEAVGSSSAEANHHAARLVSASASPQARIVSDDASSEIWKIREEGAGRATRLQDGTPAWPGLEDAAVPPERLGDYLESFHGLLAAYGLQGTTYGHFGEGCVHVRLSFDLASALGVERFSQFMADAASLIAAHGGSISGEHGDGRARGALLSQMYNQKTLNLFADFKHIWDPGRILNPGIMVDPDPLDRAIRPMADTAVTIRPKLALSADGGNYRSAVERCVGIGKCVTREHANLMCPSYQATGAEVDSTRGRARLLQEMLIGEPIERGWRSSSIRQALDRCLSCKGCASQCPTGVDMASYKTEFLHQHYKRRLRPRIDYALGWLPLWLRLGERFAQPLNRIMDNRIGRKVIGAAAGITANRTLPPLASTTYRRRVAADPPPTEGPLGSVTLWPDTFNNHFTPHVLDAATAVLRQVGFGINVPTDRVCCGLTWISSGQLDRAERVLRKSVMQTGGGDNPVVVLEPSCAATLRHDLPELLPNVPAAHQLAKRVTTFAEILVDADIDWDWDSKAETPPAVVQPHCHQQAVLGTEADRKLMAQAGIASQPGLAGCCGLAGNFGMSPAREELAQQVAELSLVPALDAAGPTVPIIADGFSCRVQIDHLGRPDAHHLAEVLADLLSTAGESRR